MVTLAIIILEIIFVIHLDIGMHAVLEINIAAVKRVNGVGTLVMLIALQATLVQTCPLTPVPAIF